ncbi:uncharacterized protein LOC107421997 isoform X1 [Ziziphus jujuba]|uniref:Uncharacterized protein LOC107421997 isoform X1 n=1 Tax=Ziziphus jujuba TaxID=326968 RepID=A0ABM3IR84_ZIZJJ|nr:uncharacterized protein LOC107421997 isoform X1 [Ziziphus jujuba]XP_048333871.2 uncharacterized protein LOC107421997 isoform X1 [Ziziphus jujuba]XP_048333872.2 uncharacterized protein LOC107421997 isoform X1 [Ziziphus jujuba]
MEQMIYQSLPSTSLGLSSVGGTVSVCSIHHRWPSVWPSVSLSSFSSSCFRKRNLKKAKPLAFTPHHHHHQQPQNQEDEDFQVLTATRSHYNDIVILDTPKSRVLLLDSSHNVHSILYKHQKWTGSYWDEFASLPAIVPQGPIAILGLGGGTAAHLMLELWPALQLEGWEIDQILIDKARVYFGLSDLEKHTQAGGVLNIHIGDAFSPSVNISGGYAERKARFNVAVQTKMASIIVDLFSGGKVLPQLEEVTTWSELYNLLMPNGRFMVNCGGTSGATDSIGNPDSSTNETCVQNSTIKALSKAFPGQTNWKKMAETNGENYLALTGPLPDLVSWSTMVPDPLCSSVLQWRPYESLTTNSTPPVHR